MTSSSSVIIYLNRKLRCIKFTLTTIDAPLQNRIKCEPKTISLRLLHYSREINKELRVSWSKQLDSWWTLDNIFGEEFPAHTIMPHFWAWAAPANWLTSACLSAWFEFLFKFGPILPRYWDETTNLFEIILSIKIKLNIIFMKQVLK